MAGGEARVAEESTGLSLPMPEVRSSSSYTRSSPVLLVLPVRMCWLLCPKYMGAASALHRPPSP